MQTSFFKFVKLNCKQDKWAACQATAHSSSSPNREVWIPDNESMWCRVNFKRGNGWQWTFSLTPRIWKWQMKRMQIQFCISQKILFCSLFNSSLCSCGNVFKKTHEVALSFNYSNYSDCWASWSTVTMERKHVHYRKKRNLSGFCFRVQFLLRLQHLELSPLLRGRRGTN